MDLSIWILISGLIFIIPAIVQIRNYIFIGSPNYLLFASLFVFVILDQVVVSLDRDEFIFEIIITASFILIFSIIIQLSSDIIDNKLPINSKSWKIIAFSIFILTLIFKFAINEEYLSDNHTPLRIIIGELYRIFAGYMLVYAFRKTKFVVESDKTNLIKKFWIIAGLFTIITGILRSINYAIEWILLVLFELDRDDDIISNLESAGEIIGLIAVISLGLLTIYIALIYPETMLLSHVQVMKAAHIYDIIEKYQDPTQIEETDESLIDYIRSIPRSAIIKQKK